MTLASHLTFPLLISQVAGSGTGWHFGKDCRIPLQSLPCLVRHSSSLGPPSDFKQDRRSEKTFWKRSEKKYRLYHMGCKCKANSDLADFTKFQFRGYSFSDHLEFWHYRSIVIGPRCGRLTSQKRIVS